MKAFANKFSALLLVALAVMAFAVTPVLSQETLNYNQQGGSVTVINGELRLHGVSLGVASGKNYYVSGVGAPYRATCSDTADGKSWTNSWCTVAHALTIVASYDIIRVAGLIDEQVTIPYATSFVRIVGAGHGPHGAHWKNMTANTGPGISCNGEGALIANIYFEPSSTQPAIQLNRSVGQTTAKCNNAKILENEFWTGFQGVALNGAPHNVEIARNVFRNMRATNATAIKVVATADALPFRNLIHHNIFSGNVNHLVGAFSDAMIYENIMLSAATGATTTTKISLVGGSNNSVSRNVLGGTYSIAGGYAPGTSDEWVGDFIAGGLSTANPS